MGEIYNLTPLIALPRDAGRGRLQSGPLGLLLAVWLYLCVLGPRGVFIAQGCGYPRLVHAVSTDVCTLY